MLSVVPLIVEPQNFGSLGVVHIFRIVVALIEEPLLDLIIELVASLEHFGQFDAA
jgi:hypothetical protein